MQPSLILLFTPASSEKGLTYTLIYSRAVLQGSFDVPVFYFTIPLVNTCTYLIGAVQIDKHWGKCARVCQEAIFFKLSSPYIKTIRLK